MLDSSLSVKKTVTATGVKAPTITGGSSGGGGTASTPKIAINGLKNPIGEIQMNVGDLKDETEAKKSLPSMVTLLVDNKEIKDVTAKIGDWKIKNGAFDGNTAGSYTFVGTVKIPDGYAYSNGTLTAKATITVVANNATKKQLTTDAIVQYGRIESYTEIDKEIKKALPTEVFLKCEDGSLIVGTIKNKDSWNRFGSPSSGSGEMSGYMEYPFHCDCADITLPAGYVFSQSSTITAHVYVKNRDNGKLQTALNAAWVQLDRTTNSEAEALANPDKIYLLPTNDDERNVSQGVKYVQESVQLTVTALNYTDSNGSTVNLGQEVATYTCTVGAPVSKADELPTLLTSGKDKANVYIRLKGTGTASVITVSDEADISAEETVNSSNSGLFQDSISVGSATTETDTTPPNFVVFLGMTVTSEQLPAVAVIASIERKRTPTKQPQ